jgi:hypothetical protein
MEYALHQNSWTYDIWNKKDKILNLKNLVI